MTKRPDKKPDDLMIGGLEIFQEEDEFRFGTDAVLLSDYVRAGSTDNIIDLGTGSGILPLLLSAKTDAAAITGIEIRPEAARLAETNAAHNHLDSRISIVCGDIKNAPEIFGHGSFQIVVTNPPYTKNNAGLKASGNKCLARSEVAITLTELLKSASALLPAKGRFYMIHKANRLAEIIGEMQRAKIEPKKIRLVYPRVGKEAKLVLIMGIRDGGSQTTVEPPLILYNEDGSESDELKMIYSKYAQEA